MALALRSLLGPFSLAGLSSGLMITGIGSMTSPKIFVPAEKIEDSKKLIENAGLVCKGDYCWPSESRKRKFNVGEEEGGRGDDLVFGPEPRGKMKIHRYNDGYTGGLRFTIELSSIPLYSRKSRIKSSITPLEEYESYEIRSRGNRYFLHRTKDSREGKILDMSLPGSCTLPETEDVTCSISSETLKEVKFEGELVGEVTSNVSLTISKTKEESFREGFKFTFTFPEDVTIGGKVVKANSPTDFKMKRHEDGHLTLERAWANENDLINKVGLSCEEGDNCTLKTERVLKIKKAEEDQDFQEISNISPGKIKLRKESKGFSNGLAFEVQGGKIGSDDKALEEFENYEIREGEEEYYLFLKKNTDERIKELLNYPDRCSLSSCEGMDEGELKAINFEGKDKNSISLGNKKAKITVASESEFPLGKKFTIESPVDVSIGGKVVKANAPTDFKIKRIDDGNLTLERAWSKESELIGKVGLSCEEDGTCSLDSSGTLKIRKNNKSLDISSLAPGSIKLYKNTPGYSNELKFEIEGGKIGSEANTLEEFETYEIKGSGNEYHLNLKTSVEDKIKELLKYPKRCSLSSACDGLKEDEFKNINFSDKNESLISIAKDKKVKITVAGAPEGDFTLGRKFTVESTGDLDISSTTSVKANIPTEFKIKRDGSGQNTTLSLEKAWTLQTLTEKVGLKCDDDNNCTITPKKLNVRREREILTGASRKDNPQTVGKIKVIEGQAGYNGGFKFQIQDAEIKLSSTERKDSILGEFESYEIKNEGDIYYLIKTATAIKEKWSTLGLPERCVPLGGDRGCPIFEGDLKNIKFSEKDPNGAIKIPRGARVFLKSYETSDPTYPMGIKIRFEIKDGEIRIPKKNSGYFILWEDTEVDFKVKKEENGDYSLEKAIKASDISEMLKKVGINNANCTEEEGCTIGPKVNVWRTGQRYWRGANVAQQSKKITYQTGVSGGFNNGIVFTVPEGDIKLNGTGSAPQSIGGLRNIEEGTYDIRDYNLGSNNGNEKISYLSWKQSFTFKVRPIYG